MANAGYLPGTERRRQILIGAKKVFAKRGYHDTNISHIVDDLGIARGTLYQYFKSKHEVFTAIVQDLLDRVRDVVAHEPKVELAEGTVLTREDVIRYTAHSVRRCLQAVFEDEASLRILVREAVGLDVRIDKIIRAIDKLVIDRFASDIAAAQKLGVLRKDIDPHTAALFVLGGVQKLALSALERKAPIDLDAIAYAAAKIQMNGLLSPEVST